MESRAKLLGHPLHQILIVFPLGLLSASIVFDVMQIVLNDGKWSTIAFYLIAGGVVGGLAAAVFGLIDYLAIPSKTRAKRVGRLHGLVSIAVIVLFSASWYLRLPGPATPDLIALVLSFGGGAFAGFTGWLGGELVNRMGVGIAPDANLNAPSSLSSISANPPTGHSRIA